jgi:flavin-dependent dehydrogenase
MYVDSRRLDTKRAIDTDVCVIGAGAAGITLALELAGQRFRVCLLESGGLTVARIEPGSAASPLTYRRAFSRVDRSA